MNIFCVLRIAALTQMAFAASLDGQALFCIKKGGYLSTSQKLLWHSCFNYK